MPSHRQGQEERSKEVSSNPIGKLLLCLSVSNIRKKQLGIQQMTVLKLMTTSVVDCITSERSTEIAVDIPYPQSMCHDRRRPLTNEIHYLGLYPRLPYRLKMHVVAACRRCGGTSARRPATASSSKPLRASIRSMD